MKEKCYYHHAKFWWCTAPVCKYFMCVRVHVFVSFLKRVSKLAKPNPTMQARASTSLLHEAFSKKILEKFTVVIASWLDCRQLGFTITQKQNDMKQLCTPPLKKHKCTRQLRFQNILQLVEWSSQRAVLHVLHGIFMLMCVWKVLNGDSRVSTTSWPIIAVGSATNLAKSQAGL